MARMKMHFKTSTTAKEAVCGKKVDVDKNPAAQVWSIVTCKDCKDIQALRNWK